MSAALRRCCRRCCENEPRCRARRRGFAGCGSSAIRTRWSRLLKGSSTLPLLSCLKNLPDGIPDANPPGGHDPGVQPAETQAFAGRRIHESHRVGPEALDEFSAAGMGLISDLDYRGAQRQSRARGKVLLAQIQIDEQLIAGERP